eukprot:6752615-Pyramimonas_sp.AAC.1
MTASAPPPWPGLLRVARSASHGDVDLAPLAAAHGKGGARSTSPAARTPRRLRWLRELLAAGRP